MAENRPYEVMVILDAGLEEDAIRTTIDEFGGSFVMNFETVLIMSTRLG